MAKNKSHESSSDSIRVVTTGSNIRFEPAKSSRQAKQAKPAKVLVSVTQDISPVGNFLDFLKQHAVIGLIIGFVLGNQVQTLVKQIVQSFIDPLTQLLFGTALSTRTFTLHFRNHYANFGWGALIYAVIIFLFVLVTMYIVIRFLKLDKLEKEINQSTK
jgi:large-conductance mechanosensitive channel